MKRVLRLIAKSLLVLVVVLFAAGLGAAIWANGRYARAIAVRYDVPPMVLHRSVAAANRRNGEYLVKTRHGCVMCHGDDLAGGSMPESKVMVGDISGPNLTPANLGGWTDGEVARAIHHGIHKSGRILEMMPANEYQHLSEGDLTDVIAYLRSVPAVTKPDGPVRMATFLKVFYSLGMVPMAVPAQMVDHAAALQPDPPRGVNAQRGAYFYKMLCISCHKPDRTGGKIMPGMPAAANITADALSTWTEADFLKTVTTGVNPSGHKLDPMMGQIVEKALSHWKKDDLRCLWAYLSAAPTAAKGSKDF